MNVTNAKKDYAKGALQNAINLINNGLSKINR